MSCTNDTALEIIQCHTVKEILDAQNATECIFEEFELYPYHPLAGERAYEGTLYHSVPEQEAKLLLHLLELAPHPQDLPVFHVQLHDRSSMHSGCNDHDSTQELRPE